METASRLSRFSRSPILGEDNRPVRVRRPTEADRAKLEALSRHRFLTCEWLAACTGASAQATVNRINVLKRDPNNFVKIAGEMIDNQRAYLFMPLFYELDAKGIAYLDQCGITVPKRQIARNFEHQAMTDQIMASFEIGAKKERIDIISWADILASEKMPQKSRESVTPHAIPITYHHAGKKHERRVTADAHPFGLRRNIDGKTSYIFVSGPETDCATEPIASYDFDRSSIQGKLLAYIAIIEQKTFHDQFGVPNFFIPFYTTTSTRMESMMRMLDKLTDGKGCKNILFATHPSIYAPQRAVPSGKALTQAYKRVGYPDFYFNK